MPIAINDEPLLNLANWTRESTNTPMTLNVLFIDSYDSFTYNLVSLIKKTRPDIHVTVIHNDTFGDIQDLLSYFCAFDCIVVGPGPGNPVNGPKDIGILDQLYKHDVPIPILGICLGYQAMCRAARAEVKELEVIRHGQVFEIEIDKPNHELFQDYPVSFKSVRYHSLHVISHQQEIIPLCHTIDGDHTVLMGAQIAGKPWYGVQYHPESCCSELGGLLIKNFITICESYNQSSKRLQSPFSLITDSSIKSKLVSYLDCKIDKHNIYDKPKPAEVEIQIEEFRVTKSPSLTLGICNKLSQHFFLMSSASIHANRGELSIIALPNEHSTVFTHYDQIHTTTIHQWRNPTLTRTKFKAALEAGKSIDGLEVVRQKKPDFYTTIGNFMKDKIIANNPELPFIGGLVGTLGYEMGQYTTSSELDPLKPDAKLVFIENCIVVDHKKEVLYLISLAKNFPDDVKSLVTDVISKEEQSFVRSVNLPEGIHFDIEFPTKDKYLSAFRESQKYLHQGDSYEVCLTTQTEVSPSKRLEPWVIFQTLITRNPAPFSSYFEFSDIEEGHSDLCLLSTSPERFLKWSDDTCELRPIKGTVKKSPNMDLQKATNILKTPKEFGENLMILDLIRNDLYELLDNVTVDELMSVEEYETVYQLVSVVKGHQLRESVYSGLDLLYHSLPPGSMTGAPKKTTVELLQHVIERSLNGHIYKSGGRGLYSGVTGYLSCNDHGDWSVNIRCMYSYDNANTWRLGAGGAVTVLSTPDGEWEEMQTKLESALQVFM